MTPPGTGQPVVALTGGTGFVGQHAAVALAAAGWQVRLLCRRDIVAPRLAGLTPELVLGDMADAGALRRLTEGAMAVVHVAGLTKAPSQEAFMRVNRDGTALLAGVLAAGNPAARCILVSSLAARMPGLSPYAASKRAGEDAVRATATGGRWTILRPGVVYGPGDHEGRVLRRLARARLAPQVRDPAPRLAMLHVRDLAEAIVALCAAAAPGGDYELSDAAPEGHTTPALLRLAAELLGCPPPRALPLPDAAFRWAGAVADAAAWATGRGGVFGRGKARELLHRDWRADPAKAVPAALWQPRITLAEGMRDTVQWWQTTGG